MVSEAEIAEARRKAIRNGEEDPVTVAQRYLNVYRQMHIFSEEKKEEFDKSLLNLAPIIITVISSLPGGLIFQEYIDEVLTKAGREKSAKSEGDTDNSPSVQPQILSNAQRSIQPQQIVAPIMGGDAKLSMGKEFADEFAKIITGVVEKQSIIQKDSLAKVAQDLSKTQLFIAKKLEDNKVERQTEMNELCKTIAQSHTALSTTLATISENISNQNQSNNLVPIPAVERSPEDDTRLVEMITQSQERMMTGLLARLPQAVGVGNVNVTAATRSSEDDIRLAEIIAQSQEKILSKLLDRLPQTSISETTASMPTPTEKITTANHENIEGIISLMAKSQEKLIETLTEKLPQMNANIYPPTVISSTRSPEDDERLVKMITKSQEKLISTLIDRIPLSERNGKSLPEVPNRNEKDDERLIHLITTSQESMIKSLIEKNIFVAQVHPQNSAPIYNQYQPIQPIVEGDQSYQNTPAENTDNQYYQSENSFSYSRADNNPQTYMAPQNTQGCNSNEIDFTMFTPVEDVNNISPALYDNIPQTKEIETYAQTLADEGEVKSEPEIAEGNISQTKKKKKKKKKKNNINEISSANEERLNDGLEFLDNISNEDMILNFEDIDHTQNNDYLNGVGDVDIETTNDDVLEYETNDKIENFDIEKDEAGQENDTFMKVSHEEELPVYDDIDNEFEEQNKKEEITTDNSIDNNIENDKGFVNKWLDFEEDNKKEDISTKKEKWDENESLTRAVWDIDDEDDSWGITYSKENSIQENGEGWEYIEDTQDEYTDGEGWEYVEDTEDEYTDGEGWEYIEDTGDEYTDGEGWEYVEAINDNTKIYSSDSFNQKVVQIANTFDKTSKIHLANIPQICDEANDDEIDDPYKNSILKD